LKIVETMVQLNMESGEYDRQVKIVIGGLLHRACSLTKSVLQQFDASVTRKANASNLSKLKLDSLEPCAEFLNIELADKDSNKIYTKSTLAPRIVSALFALLPANCSQCNEDYCVEFECNDPPLLTCYKCFQGSHNCDKMKSTYAPLAELQLPSGLVWLCKGCIDEFNPIVPRKSKSRHNSVSFKDDSKTNLSQDLTSSSSTLENGKNELFHKLNKHESDSKSDICDKYKVGKCPHGYKGTKLVDNKTCPKSHPPKCNKFLRFGSKGAKGCKKGRDCKYFHPILCKFSLKSRTCFDPECSFPHLKGTQRDPEKQRKRANSQQRDNSQQRSVRKADISESAQKTKTPTK